MSPLAKGACWDRFESDESEAGVAVKTRMELADGRLPEGGEHLSRERVRRRCAMEEKRRVPRDGCS
jgi:hypothetical protein